ncbi:excinuclease ABC subunit UvrC [Acidobacteriota bacterium]
METQQNSFQRLKQKVERFPAFPGVYIMKDERGRIIYVGKAKNLKNRVKSYFTENPDERLHVAFLKERIANIEFVVTRNEKEALILENDLIKNHQPRYNIRLKDDKAFLSLRIDLKKDFPRFEVIRKIKSDGAKYVGPFTSAVAARHTLRLLERTFAIRSCSDYVHEHRKRPCMYYHIGQCPGTCKDLITPAEYHQSVRQALLFLEGKNRQLLNVLHRRMRLLADKELFEEAACLRDRIVAVEKTIERQAIAFSPDLNCDAFVLFWHHFKIVANIVQIRRGRIADTQIFKLRGQGAPNKALLSSILLQYYSGARDIPPQLLIEQEPASMKVVEDILGERRGGRIRFLIPSRGAKKKILDLAVENTKASLILEMETSLAEPQILEDLREFLALSDLPRRIECYDISNIHGSHAVGSRVVFVNGKPYKRGYRHYKIRDSSSPDDTAMMREVLTRRFRKGEKYEPDPELIIMDGGPGQLGVALEVLRDAGNQQSQTVALSKGRGSETRMDRIYVAKGAGPLPVTGRTAPELLLKRIRDEAHRFAIAYHRKLRKSRSLRSKLDSIPGIGPAKRSRLLRHFGSVRAIAQAAVNDLMEVPGISRKLAETIVRYLSLD